MHHRDRKVILSYFASYSCKNADLYCIYHIAGISTKYGCLGSKYIPKKVKQMTALMKRHNFSLLGLIMKIHFVGIAEVECDTNIVQETVAVGMLCCFMNRTAGSVLITPLNPKCIGRNHSQFTCGTTKYFTTYSQTVIFLLKKYATSRLIAKTKLEIRNFAQQPRMA